MADIPNDLEANKDGQDKHYKVLHKACRCVATDQKQQRPTNGQKCYLILGLLFESLNLFRALFLRSFLWGTFSFGLAAMA